MGFALKAVVGVCGVVVAPWLHAVLWRRRRTHTVAENGDIVLLDLKQPVLPVRFRVMNAVLGPFMYRSVPTVESVMEHAMRKPGLEDFGDEEKFPFREGLVKYLEDVKREYAKLTFLGRIIVRLAVLQVLENRLRIVDVVKRHPEILQEKVEDPVIIIGPSRSGTTHLHHALGQHEALRTLKLFELAMPVMSPETEEALLNGERDPRLSSSEDNVKMLLTLRPFFRLLHEVSADGPEEDHQLMGCTFQAAQIAITLPSLNYMRWRRAIDETPGLEFFKLALQVFQWQDVKVGKPRKRFLLKSPGHMNTVRELVKVFPDMKVVQTFREPSKTFTSVAYLYAYLWGSSHKEVDLEVVTQFASEMIHEMYSKHERDLQVIHDRSFVINFSDYKRDNAGFLKKVLDFVGESCAEEDMKPILDYLTVSQRFNKGRIRYTPDAFGWNMQEIEDRFSAYRRYLGTPASA